jgi:eukaryotic-like serine/threonine-protein kinase
MKADQNHFRNRRESACIGGAGNLRFTLRVKRFFQLALLALVLVAVAMISALTAMRMAIHGRQVRVPNVVGMSAAEARKTTLAADLLLDREGGFYSRDVPEGHVLSQAPAAGTLVRRGWQVRIAESLGPQRTAVPDLVNESERAAEINITRRGLDVGTVVVAHIPGQPPDQVVAQSPPPNAQGMISPKINLLVTAPAEPAALIMPSFSGRPLADASKAIQGAGLRVAAVNTLPVPGLPAGTVLKQSPEAGQKVTPGTAVTLEVAQ